MAHDPRPPVPILFTPIGVIRSSHLRPEATPAQPVFATGCVGMVEIFPAFVEGLRDLEGFSHVYLIYHLHRADGVRLTVKPFLQDKEHGIFATRAPWRPNPIGMSIVRLVGRDANILQVEGIDVLDGTPLLDIKPYAKRFDRIDTRRDGWMDEVDDETAQIRGRRDFPGN